MQSLIVPQSLHEKGREASAFFLIKSRGIE